MDTTQTEGAGILPADTQIRLVRMFRFLSDEKKIKYKALAMDIGENVETIYSITCGRKPGSHRLLKKVEDYYKANQIEFLDTGANDDEFGLDYVLDALEVDSDVINRSVILSSGKHLLFSKLASGKITVTWFELFGTSKTLTIPVFKARRLGRDGRELIYKGVYYEHASTLFIFGHIESTPLVRSLVLVPVGSPGNKDRHGVMSGASAGETLFVSACYFKRLDDSASWKDFEHVIKENDAGALREEFGAIVDSLTGQANLCMSVFRDS